MNAEHAPFPPRTLLVAEVGMNHDGSLGNAKRMVDLAAECGADAAKFQTHIAHAETLRNAPMPSWFKGEPRWDYFTRTSFTKDEWKELRAHCDANGIEFLSSPFSHEAVDLLEEVGVRRYKIPSGEVTNVPLLEHVGRTGKPVLLSSGMSSWAELDLAVKTLTRFHSDVTVLQCTSEYPCPPDRVGLNLLAEMRVRYGLPVGLSDHTLTNHAAVAAVVLGATVIEKHFTLSRLMYGSDAKHSLEPPHMRDLVEGVRSVEAILASPVNKDDLARFAETKRVFEKSVVTVAEIPAGATITPEMVGVKKPGTGIPARRLLEVVGRKARRAIAKDSLVAAEDLEEFV